MGCFEATDIGTSLSKIKIIADHYDKVVFSDEKQLRFSKQAHVFTPRNYQLQRYLLCYLNSISSWLLRANCRGFNSELKH